MIYLVTGYQGAIGSFMCERLAVLGHTMIRFGRAELASVTAATNALAQQPDPDIVFHFAADADVRKSFDEPVETFRNNVGCTAILLDALRVMALRPRVVLASTPEVYGPKSARGYRGSPWPFYEDDPMRPANAYAASKAAQEALVHAYGQAYGIPYVITRAGSYINPRRKDLALSAFAWQIVDAERRGDHFTLRHGNLDTVRPWCDARDIIEAYLLAAEKGFTGQTYNVGAPPGVATRLGAVLDLLLAQAKVPVELKLDPALLRPTDVTYQALDVSRFSRLTGWEPKIPLSDSLEWLLNTCRAGGHAV